MRSMALLAAGSLVGGFARYALAGIVYRAAGSSFPYGTLAVNLIACLLIGAFEGLSEGPDARLGLEGRLLLMSGFCGAFSTFSTLCLELSSLFKGGQWGRGAAYLAISVALGLLLLRVGMAGGRLLRT
jgi:fluoride exporter